MVYKHIRNGIQTYSQWCTNIFAMVYKHIRKEIFKRVNHAGFVPVDNSNTFKTLKTFKSGAGFFKSRPPFWYNDTNQ